VAAARNPPGGDAPGGVARDQEVGGAERRDRAWPHRQTAGAGSPRRDRDDRLSGRALQHRWRNDALPVIAADAVHATPTHHARLPIAEAVEGSGNSPIR
jgi:hypothetical protein